mmetsp:Transcript_27056/g.65825  ORF Transcript_27056/g.65825 Transcript_27056/m.65825 type:complete len:188 (+) Transcript_27056:1543-2106(+)
MRLHSRGRWSACWHAPRSLLWLRARTLRENRARARVKVPHMNANPQRQRDIDWPLKAFVYILPFRWAIASVVRLAIGDGDYAGAAAADNEPEYVCSGNQDICYGRTGEQVLRSLARQWPTFAPKDNNWTEVGYLVCIALGFKLVFSLLFVYVTRPASPPRTPGKRQARDRGLSVRGLRRDSARESAV